MLPFVGIQGILRTWQYTRDRGGTLKGRILLRFQKKGISTAKGTLKFVVSVLAPRGEIIHSSALHNFALIASHSSRSMP
jgi:hypothetical protein